MALNINRSSIGGTRSRAYNRASEMPGDESVEATSHASNIADHMRSIFHDIQKQLNKDKPTPRNANVLQWDPVMDEGVSILSVTWRPLHRWKYPSMPIAILYSYIPHLVMVIFLIRSFAFRDLMSIEGLVLLSVVAVMNDIGIKRLFRQPRPDTSRAHGYGMPSSHCATSYATMVWMIYETWYGPDVIKEEMGLAQHTNMDDYRGKKVIFSLASCLLFMPMPWARVETGDHTKSQAFVGLVIGSLVGMFYVVFVLEGSEDFPLTRVWYQKWSKQL